MRRGGVAAGLAASPTLVGAVTVMIVIVTVFLAYNANTGLPFVPTYRISAQVPNASLLVVGNEVRVGGIRVGLVEDIEPVQAEDGSVTANLDLKLDADLDPLPTDSTVIVRARSALGLKYLEILRGSSDEGYEQGGTIPLTAYGAVDPDVPGELEQPVEIDEVLSTFDEPTRIAIRENLVEFGNALAGRGPDLNSALGRLPRVLEFLEPVMTNLNSSETDFAGFISASAAAAAEVARLPKRRRGCSSRSTPPSPPSPTSPGRSSRRRSRRRRPPSRSGPAPCRRSAPSSPTAPRSSTSCSPASTPWRGPRR